MKHVLRRTLQLAALLLVAGAVVVGTRFALKALEAERELREEAKTQGGPGSGLPTKSHPSSSPHPARPVDHSMARPPLRARGGWTSTRLRTSQSPRRPNAVLAACKSYPPKPVTGTPPLMHDRNDLGGQQETGRLHLTDANLARASRKTSAAGRALMAPSLYSA